MVQLWGAQQQEAIALALEGASLVGLAFTY